MYYFKWARPGLKFKLFIYSNSDRWNSSNDITDSDRREEYLCVKQFIQNRSGIY
jgi:hypothetical protein